MDLSNRKSQLLALLCWGFLACFMSSTPVHAVDKHDVAARITVSIAKFSSWPSSANVGGTITIGLYRGSSAYKAFRKLEGEKLKGRKIEVMSVSGSSDLSRCQIVVTTSEKELASAAKATAGKGVLIVHLGAGQRSGADACISLYERNNKMKFDVYLPSLKQRKIQLHSNVLKLASVVHRS